MLFIQLSLLVFYVTRSLMFTEKVSHYGPFSSSKKFVTRVKNNYHQPVTLFDWIRRLSFNPYEVNGDLWVIQEKRLEVWTCPFCLSFWVSFLGSAIFGITVQSNLLELITVHFSLAAMSAIINYLVDYVQLRLSESS